jgi:Rop protein
MNKQEKTALNMAKFVRDQASVLLEKLKDLDLDDQVDICEQLHTQAEGLYQSLSKSLTE